MFKFVLVLAVATLALGTPQVKKSFVPKLDGRIVGGESTTIEEYPYQLSLQHFGSHICGATLVGPKSVVTAAHCTDGIPATYLSIRAGSSTRNSGGQVINVLQVRQHHKYNMLTFDYDVSVLKLASAVTVENSATIGLAASGSSVPTGALATVTGWGSLSQNGGLPTQLQVVQVPFVSQASCKAAYGSSAITDRMLCAGYDSGGKDSCQGDSGGPLVFEGKLVGIVSWGYGCARPHYPGVYSSVSNLRDFIDSNN